MFIKDSKVEIADGPNVVVVRARMNFGIRNLVSGDAVVFADASRTFNMGAYNTALLVHNILEWRGPAFEDEAGKPIPCTAAMIQALDPDEPLVDRIVQALHEANAPKQAVPDPNAPLTPDGSSSSTSKAAAKK